jgi:hypothetical protein
MCVTSLCTRGALDTWSRGRSTAALGDMNSDDCHVLEWNDAPQIDMGAPMPEIALRGRDLFVAYIVSGSVIDEESEELYAVVRFGGVLQHIFGYPNEDAFIVHPLFACGLSSTGFNEVRNSPYVRELASRNKKIYPRSEATYLGLKHWIVPFHDETLEVIGDTVQLIRTVRAQSAAKAISKVNEVQDAQ